MSNYFLISGSPEIGFSIGMAGEKPFLVKNTSQKSLRVVKW